ncbi:hypothetical protein NDU88_007144 [Pleurodeles waltl]|uniref:Uncharacterized protein n=1 Tax=Pleurodeles waltl TaxID=8319 RepID=A0AAV7SRH2_PLEWA|nr:hypothetical protein NDU88_007144 [Pleurodeles waltl]
MDGADGDDGGVGDGEVPGSSEGTGEFDYNDELVLSYEKDDAEEGKIVDDGGQEAAWWAVPHDVRQGCSDANQRRSFDVIQEPVHGAVSMRVVSSQTEAGAASRQTALVQSQTLRPGTARCTVQTNGGFGLDVQSVGVEAKDRNGGGAPFIQGLEQLGSEKEKELLLTRCEHGFCLYYKGPWVRPWAEDLKSIKGHEVLVCNKLMEEVHKCCMEGRFEDLPLENLGISPIGVVPKKKPDEFNLIQHLLWPEGSSVNYLIPEALSRVNYASVDTALVNMPRLGTLMAYCDMKSAFRLLPVHPSDYELLYLQISGEKKRIVEDGVEI